MAEHIDPKEFVRIYARHSGTCLGIAAGDHERTAWLRIAVADHDLACVHAAHGALRAIVANRELMLKRIGELSAPREFCAGWHSITDDGELEEEYFAHCLTREEVQRFTPSKNVVMEVFSETQARFPQLIVFGSEYAYEKYRAACGEPTVETLAERQSDEARN